MPFPSSNFLDEITHEPTARVFRTLYADWQAFFQSAGFNADGSFRNVVVNNIVLQANPERPPVSGPDGVPVYGGVTVINAPGSPNRGATAFDVGCTCQSCLDSGTLIFSGYGDAPMKFYTPAGVRLPPPSTNPWVGTSGGAGGCQGIACLADGRVGVTGANYPAPGFANFAAFADVSLASMTGFDIFQNGSIGCNNVDAWYAIKQVAPMSGNYLLRKFTAAGLATSWDLGSNPFPIFSVLGMSSDATAYWGQRGGSTITSFDTGTLTSAVFAVEAATLRDNSMLALPNGNVLAGWGAAVAFVRLYDPAGATVKDFALSGATGGTPLTVTLGRLNGSSFWVSYYTPDAATFSGVRVEEFDIESGNILNSFDPEDGTFEFDGPFCESRQPFAV